MLCGGSGPVPNGYADWAVVVVAGDWHAHDGSPSEIFDNARRDVSAGFIGVGFSPANIVQFSVRPERYPASHLLKSDVGNIADTLSDLAGHARGGCLLYFTSHGSSAGIVLGEHILAPQVLDSMISDSCGMRPTVIVVSACYSGSFVGPLARPNRMILTAARKDRSSFGCSGTDRYPYFDSCFIAGMRSARSFREEALQSALCVSRLERRTRMSPPSEPQLFTGNEIASRLPGWR